MKKVRPLTPIETAIAGWLQGIVWHRRPKRTWLASATHINRTRLNEMMRGQKRITPGQLKRIAAAFGVTVAAIHAQAKRMIETESRLKAA